MEKLAPDCRLCGRQSKSFGSLVKHVAQTHCVGVEEYYAKYFGAKPACQFCSSTDVRFLSLSEGYAENCRSCTSKQRSLSAKQMFVRIKKDKTKYEEFKRNTSEAVKQVWKSGVRPRRQKPVIVEGVERDERICARLLNSFGFGAEDGVAARSQLQSIVNKNLNSVFGID